MKLFYLLAIIQWGNGNRHYSIVSTYPTLKQCHVNQNTLMEAGQPCVCVGDSVASVLLSKEWLDDEYFKARK